MARKQGTMKIHADWWDTGEFVEIRSYMSHGAKKAIQAAMAQGIDLGSMNVAEGTELDMSAMKMDTTKLLDASEDAEPLHFIVSWTLADGQGTILPYVPTEALQASLNALADEDVQFIKSAIDKLSIPAMTEAERANFLATPSAGTVAPALETISQ